MKGAGQNNNTMVARNSGETLKSSKSPGFSELVRKHNVKKDNEAKKDSQMTQSGCSKDTPDDFDEFSQPLDYYENIEVEGMQYSVDPNDDNFNSGQESESDDDKIIMNAVEMPAQGDIPENGGDMEVRAEESNEIDRNKLERIRQEVEEDPEVQSYIDALVEQRYQNKMKERNNMTPQAQTGTKGLNSNLPNVIKSPSDTTL